MTSLFVNCLVTFIVIMRSFFILIRHTHTVVHPVTVNHPHANSTWGCKSTEVHITFYFNNRKLGKQAVQETAFSFTSLDRCIFIAFRRARKHEEKTIRIFFLSGIIYSAKKTKQAVKITRRVRTSRSPAVQRLIMFQSLLTFFSSDELT